MKAAAPPPARMAGFRVRLFAAIMLIVSATTLLALYFAERSLAGRVAADLERAFESELAKLRLAEEGRRAALLERCRTLVRKPRIRAAFEDDALDLLYPNAEDELRDILVPRDTSHPRTLRARFYRFLDSRGAVIPPPNLRTVGALPPAAEARLALPRLPASTQVGFLHLAGAGREEIALIMATPIVSTESGGILGALVLGFDPAERPADPPEQGMKSGWWIGDAFHSSAFSRRAAGQIVAHLDAVLATGEADVPPLHLTLDEAPHLLFSQPLNPESLYPPAHEICAYPLAQLAEDQRRLRWRILGAGSALLLLGLAASHLASQRLSRPVERLAEDSEEDRQQRVRAEAALELTHAELQRSARFSADASHQLKTPVTVLRAGLEELLAREHLSPAECQEISALIHQTFRLSSLIDDLLLLSRLDAGRLKLAAHPVNLSRLIEASLDDLSALPDEFGVEVETDFPADLHVSGEQRYTSIILQNLLENARKYNRPGGRIQLRAVVEGEAVRLAVRNSGRPIPPEVQPRIFERFHRGTAGENIPGYGLGLNLARELARLHQGDLRLARSDETGTEFEVTFRRAAPPA